MTPAFKNNHTRELSFPDFELLTKKSTDFSTLCPRYRVRFLYLHFTSNLCKRVRTIFFPLRITRVFFLIFLFFLYRFNKKTQCNTSYSLFTGTRQVRYVLSYSYLFSISFLAFPKLLLP